MEHFQSGRCAPRSGTLHLLWAAAHHANHHMVESDASDDADACNPKRKGSEDEGLEDPAEGDLDLDDEPHQGQTASLPMFVHVALHSILHHMEVDGTEAARKDAGERHDGCATLLKIDQEAVPQDLRIVVTPGATKILQVTP